MTSNPEIEKFKTAAVLLATDTEYVLQHRDNKIGISEPGTLSLWGGRAKDGETPESNAVRELEEETGLIIDVSELERFIKLIYKLGILTSDNTIEIRSIEATLFIANQKRIEPFVPNEGQAAIFIPKQQLFTAKPASTNIYSKELLIMINEMKQSKHPDFLQATVASN